MGATILIVDDNAQLRAHAGDRGRGVQPPRGGEAADGAEAMRLVQTAGRLSCCWTSSCQRSTAWRSCWWIKAECPETKVIIVTVHDEDAYRQAAEASGADAFLLKKTLVTDLLPTIRRLCGCM